MDKMKQWVVLAVVGVLVVMVGGWMFLVSPKRSAAADLQSQASAADVRNTQLRSQLQMLQAQQKLMPKYEAQLAQVMTKIPDNPALPALIRSLTDAADKANVELVTMAPATPVDYQTSAGAAPAAVTAAPVAGAPAATAAPAAGAAGLKVITLSLNVVGGYFETENFFNQIESISRALKVTGFTMAPGADPMKAGTTGASSNVDDGRVLTTTMTASVFMSPSTPAAPAAAAPVAAAPVK